MTSCLHNFVSVDEDLLRWWDLCRFSFNFLLKPGLKQYVLIDRDENYRRVRRRMETSTYDWRRVHTSGYHTGDEYIRVPRGQETSTYDRRRVHMSTYKYIQVDISRYQYPKAGDQYIPVGRTGRPVQKVQIK